MVLRRDSHNSGLPCQKKIQNPSKSKYKGKNGIVQALTATFIFMAIMS